MDISGMGQWVKIRNMTYETHSGLWLGRLLPTTKLMFLPHNEPTVLECKRSHSLSCQFVSIAIHYYFVVLLFDFLRAMDERGLGKEGRLPFWSNPLPALTCNP